MGKHFEYYVLFQDIIANERSTEEDKQYAKVAMDAYRYDTCIRCTPLMFI